MQFSVIFCSNSNKEYELTAFTVLRVFLTAETGRQSSWTPFPIVLSRRKKDTVLSSE